MSQHDSSKLSIADLNPGDMISFANMAQLPVFEDEVAKHINPGMTANDFRGWSGRAAIKDLVRPQKFNGTIADITLTVMNNPYDRILDAGERGFVVKGSYKSSRIDTIDSYHGYSFLASAKSSGRGIIGQIRSELWYRVVAPGSAGLTVARDAAGGTTIRRTVATPIIDRGRFDNLVQESTVIATAGVLYWARRGAIQHQEDKS